MCNSWGGPQDAAIEGDRTDTRENIDHNSHRYRILRIYYVIIHIYIYICLQISLRHPASVLSYPTSKVRKKRLLEVEWNIAALKCLVLWVASHWKAPWEKMCGTWHRVATIYRNYYNFIAILLVLGGMGARNVLGSSWVMGFGIRPVLNITSPISLNKLNLEVIGEGNFELCRFPTSRWVNSADI